MRLASGAVFPIPITLPVEAKKDIGLDREIALRDSHNEILAIMTVTEIFEFDRSMLAQQVLGTADARHPLVAEMNRWGQVNLSGPMSVIALPRHYDFRNLRLTPAQTRAQLETKGHANVVAFQTRN